MAIRTNVQALNASNQLKQMSAAGETAARKVASGDRIGMAADDTAGMAISEKMQAHARGLTQAVRNVRDANAFFNIADGALQEADDMIKRIREISIQAANDTLTDEDRQLLSVEVEELLVAIDEIAYNTTYGSTKVFAPESANAVATLATESNTTQTFELSTGGVSQGSVAMDMAAIVSDKISSNVDMVLQGLFDAGGNLDPVELDSFFMDLVTGMQESFDQQADKEATIQYKLGTDDKVTFSFLDTSGNPVYDDIEMDIGSIFSSVLGMGTATPSTFSAQASAGEPVKQFYVQAGADQGTGHTYEWDVFDTKILTLKEAKVDPIAEALATLDKCDYAQSFLSKIRTTLGVYSNRLEFSEHIADTTRLNITEANSRIKDADIAKEMMDYTKSNVLQQAAINMVTMANQSPQRVLELLKA